MSFDIPNIHIADDSLEAKAIEQVMIAEKVDPAGAVLSILRNSSIKSNPALRLIGLFSSDEDSAAMDDVIKLIAESRKTETSREIGL